MFVHYLLFVGEGGEIREAMVPMSWVRADICSKSRSRRSSFDDDREEARTIVPGPGVERSAEEGVHGSER
jgi:hypothetical protein